MDFCLLGGFASGFFCFCCGFHNEGFKFFEVFVYGFFEVFLPFFKCQHPLLKHHLPFLGNHVVFAEK